VRLRYSASISLISAIFMFTICLLLLAFSFFCFLVYPPPDAIKAVR
jgi:hypothetical protein